MRVGEETTPTHALEQKQVIFERPLSVRCTVGKGDAVSHAVSQVQFQRVDVVLNQATTYDPLNHAAPGGLQVALGIGFIAAPSNGSAVIAGATVTVTSAPLHTYPAMSDTYRDLLPNGTFAYVSVGVGWDAPPTTATALRIAVTSTDSLGIVADVPIASTYVLADDPIVVTP